MISIQVTTIKEFMVLIKLIRNEDILREDIESLNRASNELLGAIEANKTDNTKTK